jgi:hypothetical protein
MIDTKNSKTSNMYSEYKHLFPCPSSDEIKVTLDDHDQFKNAFQNYNLLHEFLVEINYEPYMLSEKKDIKVYCNDYCKYISVYLTFQSYINNLRIARPTKLKPPHVGLMFGIKINKYDSHITFIHENKCHFKYYICRSSLHRSDLHKYYVMIIKNHLLYVRASSLT